MISKFRTSRFMGMAALALALTLKTSMAVPAATSNVAGSHDVPLPFSLGYVFTVNQTEMVTALGQFDVLGNGAGSTAKVALFNWDTGTKLTETTLAGAALEETGYYDTRFVNITPVGLAPGTRYLLATEVAANGFLYGNGIISFDSAVQWAEGRATPVGSPAMPGAANATSFPIVRTAEASGSYFGPNMKLSPAPAAIPAMTVSAVGGSYANYSTGWRFSTAVDIVVTHLGKFDIDGGGLSGGNAEVALYNATTKAKLASAIVSATSTPEANGVVNAYYASVTPVTLPAGDYIVATQALSEPFSYDSTASLAAGITWKEGVATGINQSLPATTDGFTILRSTPKCYMGGTFKFQSLSTPPDVVIDSPSSRTIVQRNASNLGSIPLTGTYSGTPDRIEARAVVMTGAGNSGSTTTWQSIAASPAGGVFSGTLGSVPAGGWYQLEVRSVTHEVPGNAVVLQKVGVGDIYVTCGQSNSANYGQGGYTASDDRVCARTAVTGSNWIPAADPIPIATGTGGSVWTRLGDMLAAADHIPVGFIAVGIGGTQVAEWIPGSSYYNNLLRPAVQSFPTSGFRAVLWHQGESDALANTSAATYAGRLNSIIAQSRTDAGWAIPWYVAEASFHPNTTLSQEEPVTAGQRQVVHADPLVFLGPTTDGFHLEDANGGKLVDTVHFNNAGLLDHAAQWRDILRSSTTITPRNGNFEDNRTSTFTGLTALADGASQIVNISADTDSPLVLGWRILSASGSSAADGSNGFHNPSGGTYAGAADTVNGGVLPNMNGRHVAMLGGGSAGNYFLHSTRVPAQPNTTYKLTAAIGVRDNPSSFGSARLEITANGNVMASASFDKSALDALHGGDASGAFTDASLSWTTDATVPANQPIAIRIVKINGLSGGNPTYLDFDNVRLTSSVSDYAGWAAIHGITGGRTDDDDHDGLSNFTEYAFGSDPKNPKSSNISPSLPNRTTGVFTYLRRQSSLGGLAYSVWYSTDLKSWQQDTGATQSVTNSSGTTETVQVTLSTSLKNRSKLFVRITAS